MYLDLSWICDFVTTAWKRTDWDLTVAMSRRKREHFSWDQPAWRCPLCPDLPPFGAHDSRAREHHVRTVHNRELTWACPSCRKRYRSGRFDDLRRHFKAVHFSQGERVSPPIPSLEPCGWEPEPRRETVTSTSRSRRGQPDREHPSSSRRPSSRGQSKPHPPTQVESTLSPPRKVTRRTPSASPLSSPCVAVSPPCPSTPGSSPPCTRTRRKSDTLPIKSSLSTRKTSSSTVTATPRRISPRKAAKTAETEQPPLGEITIVIGDDKVLPSTSTQPPQEEPQVSEVCLTSDTDSYPEAETTLLGPPAPNITLPDVEGYIQCQATPEERGRLQDLLGALEEQQPSVRPPPPGTADAASQTQRGRFVSSTSPDGTFLLEGPTISIRVLEPIRTVPPPSPPE